MLRISIPLVDQNLPGQYIALQDDHWCFDSLKVLQRHCCLECTLYRLRAKERKVYEHYKLRGLHRIINGRLPDEEMK